MKVNSTFRLLFDQNNKKRHKIIYGGAGSGKSYAVAQKIVLDFLSCEGINTLVVRKIHRTNRDSTFALICKVLNLYQHLVHINNGSMVITNKINNNQILFAGLDDVDKLKSITFKNGILYTIWVLLASECTQKDIQQLNLRLRGKSYTNNWPFSLILTFNPISEQHWLKRYYFDYKTNLSNCWIHHSTYLNNPFIDDNYKQLLLNMKIMDYLYYSIYALGKWGSLKGKVFLSNYSIQLFDINSFLNYSIGLDFGTNDPTAIILVAKLNDNIYICKLTKQIGLLNYQIHKIIQELYSQFKDLTIIADCAGLNQINLLKLLGLNIIGCSKGPDSIIAGIKWLKQNKIIIHPNCIDFIKLILSYRWRKDRKNDQSLNQPVDINNHLLDALRYSVQFWRLQSMAKFTFLPIYVDNNMGW